MKKTVSINTIAKEAGVTKSTVSKVLNNKSGYTEATRKKVQDVIDKYDYSPNFYAVQTSKRASSDLIGLIVCYSMDFSLIPYLDVLLYSTVKKAKDFNKNVIVYVGIDRNEIISSLSGGNQQKVIIGKWLQKNPDILIMDEPTRGIDIISKYQVYELIIELTKQGKAVIISSSEMPEIMGMTHNILVMSNHKIAGIIPTKEASEEKIIKLCTKYL